MLVVVALRAKRNEIVGDMWSIVHGLLSRFEESFPGLAPASLIFYRDGVSDGEWEAVLTKELNAIHHACAKLKADHPTTLTNWDPKVITLM